MRHGRVELRDASARAVHVTYNANPSIYLLMKMMMRNCTAAE